MPPAEGNAEGSSGSATSPTDPPDVGGGDLAGAAQATAAELDAAEEKARTTYVLLVLREADTPSGGKENEWATHPIEAWEEIARIKAASREAAWEEAKRRCPAILPTEDGAESHAQLVPERFWRKITATLRRPEPQVEVTGL